MESIEIIWIMFGLMAASGLFWVIGRGLDPVWRCTKMRQLLRRPYVVLKIVNKDNQLINTHVVNAEKDILTVGTDMWAITKGSIYLQTKGGKKKKESGFKIDMSSIRREEGAPTIYVDRDSIKPIGFEGRNADSVKPTEVGSTLLAWIFNQYAKKLAGVEQQKLIVIGVAILLIVNIGLTWDTNQKAEQALMIVKELRGTTPAGTTIEGETVKITQPGGSNG